MAKNKDGRKTQTSQGGEPEPDRENRTPAPVLDSEVDEFVTHLIGQHGNPRLALAKIAREQLKFRRRAQAAEADRDRFKEQLPAVGSVVLSEKKEVDAYNALKTMNITLDKVPDMIKAHQTLQAEHAKAQRAKDLSDAAGDTYDVSVLTTLLGDIPLQFKEVNERGGEDGKEIVKVRHPFVVLKDGDKETLEALDSYMERTHASFKEIWGKKEEGAESSAATTGKSAVTLPKQSSGSTTQSSQTPARRKTDDVSKGIDKALSSVGASLPSQRRKVALHRVGGGGDSEE